MKHFFILISFLNIVQIYAQGSICDSVFVSPDTYYLDQESSLTITNDFTYTGDADLSYAHLRFFFPDDSPISITDSTVTHGISGPYVFDWTFNINYHVPDIPPFTEVHAIYNVWQWHIDHEFVGCDMPVLFVINGTTSTWFPNQSLRNLRIYPNPVNDYTALTWTGKPGEIYRLSLFDYSGKQILEIDDISENEFYLERGQWPSGIYLLVLSSKDGDQAKTRKVFFK